MHRLKVNPVLHRRIVIEGMQKGWEGGPREP